MPTDRSKEPKAQAWREVNEVELATAFNEAIYRLCGRENGTWEISIDTLLAACAAIVGGYISQVDDPKTRALVIERYVEVIITTIRQEEIDDLLH